MMVLGNPADRDRGRFRLLPGFGGVELFDADFRNFVFAPHFHDTLMLGLIFEGRKRFVRGKTAHEVAAGGLSIVNPGETHTGGVTGIDRPLRYTAVYPGARLLAEAGLPEGADLSAAVVNDPVLGSKFARALAPGRPEGETEEALLIALADLAERYGAGLRHLSVSPAAVRRAVDYIQAELPAELRLEAIADRAGIGPRHLIRCFRQSMSMTPQEYIRQARVHAAAGRLRCGQPPASVAQDTGFADQPHMTRSFRTVMGITPAAYARCWRN